MERRIGSPRIDRREENANRNWRIEAGLVQRRSDFPVSKAEGVSRRIERFFGIFENALEKKDFNEQAIL
jgi:hypothetical protein